MFLAGDKLFLCKKCVEQAINYFGGEKLFTGNNYLYRHIFSAKKNFGVQEIIFEAI
jgi:hypothetical protein